MKLLARDSSTQEYRQVRGMIAYWTVEENPLQPHFKAGNTGGSMRTQATPGGRTETLPNLSRPTVLPKGINTQS